MMRQKFSLFLSLIAVLFGGLVSSSSAVGTKKDSAQANRPPSMVVFLADDVSWQDFGCYGNDAIRTPNIDALARGGLRFTNAFLTTSSCSPTRISVLTGKYPHATGAEDLHMPLPADQKFVSSYLKEQGYYTGHMRKTHYGPNGMKQFDWYSKNFDIEDFMDQSGEQPFFLWVGFIDAHRPYNKGTLDPLHDPAKVKVPPYLTDTPQTRTDLAMYYDEIGRMDQNIGRMVKVLKERGRFENTLVVFFADNGMPFPRAKGTAYDSGIGTPLVMSWPKGIKPQTTHKDLASVIDLAPTFLEIAGIAKPKDMQGGSLMPILKDSTLPGRKLVFAERNWHNCDEHIRAVRTQKYKLIRNAYLDLPYGNPSDCSSSPSWHSLLKLKEEGRLTPAQLGIFRAPRPLLELYDLEKDPFELNNLADKEEHAELIKELEKELDRWRAETSDLDPTRRRRADNTNRATGVKFTKKIFEMTDL